MPLKPYISVVIPAYNEEKRIGACLHALQKQNFSLPYEIIIADNNSTDNTAHLAKRMRIRVVTATKKGYAHACNKGTQAAKSDIIVITDADCIPPNNWLSNYYHYFLNHQDILAASGPFVFNRESIFMHTITIVIYSIHQESLVLTLSGMNMGFRKSAYYAVGGFDPNIQLQADSYFGLKIQRLGKIGFVHMDPVIASGRRFHSIPQIIWEGVFRWINLLLLRFFDRPLAHAFQDIR